jgi:stage V sporulation protein G
VEITEVRIKLMEEDSTERLKAFCSITFDDAFVVRDLKIIEGSSGPFVAMPSRKLTAHCPFCSCKNHLRANHCNQCGRRMGECRIAKDEEGRAKLYADIAHPINSTCRDMIQRRVIAEYQEELVRAKQEGYESRYDDFDLDTDFDEPIHDVASATAVAKPHFQSAAGPQTRSQRAAAPTSGGSAQAPPAKPPSIKPPTINPPSIRPQAAFGAGIFDDQAGGASENESG